MRRRKQKPAPGPAAAIKKQPAVEQLIILTTVINFANDMARAAELKHFQRLHKTR